MVVYAGLAAALCAWRLVANAMAGHYGWVAVMLICLVVNVALCVSFAKRARQ
jgi:hypothetical protein